MLSIRASAFAAFRLDRKISITAVYADASTIVAEVPCVWFGTGAPGVVGDAESAEGVRLAIPAEAWAEAVAGMTPAPAAGSIAATGAIPPPRSKIAADTAVPPQWGRMTVQRSERIPGGMIFLLCSTREAALP